eukprot:8025067-Pyramimonas_sp.AAC.1
MPPGNPALQGGAQVAQDGSQMAPVASKCPSSRMRRRRVDNIVHAARAFSAPRRPPDAAPA